MRVCTADSSNCHFKMLEKIGSYKVFVALCASNEHALHLRFAEQAGGWTALLSQCRSIHASRRIRRDRCQSSSCSPPHEPRSEDVCG
eukprot:g23883.t1